MVTETAQQTEPEEVVKNGEVSVRVSPDRMSALLTVTPPGEGGEPASVEQALAKLAEAGVIFGIDQAAVEGAVAEARTRSPDFPAEPAVVAAGRAAVPGENGEVDYHPLLLSASGRPKVRPDGGVDLFDLSLVRNVTTGTVLGWRTPPTAGEPGMSVLGAVIPAKPGREAPLRPGKGAAYTDDQLAVVAATDGHVVLVEGRIIVSPVFEVGTDIGPETGHIDFVGSVTVRGNVLAGFLVKAGGDVDIFGGVDGGRIEAGGNVTVLYGVQGGGHGHIHAGGSVKAKFIENADVQAGGSVWAADGILASRIEAGASIEVMGKRGSIIGGKVSAGDHVSARFLGSPMGGVIEIAVGVSPQAHAELGANRKAVSDENERLHRTNQGIEFLLEQHRRGQLAPEKHEMLRQLVAVRDQLVERIQGLEERCQELQAKLGEVRNAHVDALDVCYPGVRVSVGSSHLQVNDAVQHTRARLNGHHEIELSPL